MYLNKTKVRVERFVQRRGSALQSEIQFLGQKTMQVKFPVVQAILQDLVRAGLVKVTRQRIGKRKFVVVVWCQKSR